MKARAVRQSMLARLVKHVLRIDRRVALRGLVTGLVIGVSVTLIGAASRSLINALLSGRGAWIWPTIGLIAAVAALMTGTWLNYASVTLMTTKLSRDIDMALLDAEQGRAQTNHLDGGRAQQLAVMVDEQRDVLALLPVVLNSTLVLLASSTALLGFTLATSVELLPLFLGLAALALAGLAAQRRLEAAVEQTAAPTRITRSLFALMTAAGPAKDIRTGGAGEILIEDYSAVWNAQDVLLHSARRRGVLLVAGAQLVLAGLFSVSLILTLTSASIDAGTAVMAFILAIQAAAIGATVHPTLADLGQCLVAYRQFVQLAEFRAVPVTPPSQDGRHDRREALGLGDVVVRLARVVVRYGPDEPPALNGVSLAIRPGSLVAVVGENGSGKSTLARVLLGLHRPDEGELDRADASGADHDVSAVFQDFARFESTVGEGVRFGEAGADDARVRATLTGLGGGPWLSELPDKLDTSVGSSSRPGIDLSGGEWQRIALGRGTISELPGLVVLDEATSALDAQTEHRLLKTQLSQARRLARAADTAVVIITHRLSAARLADVILVMSDGSIIESGTHEALMAADGLYARMFAIQASGYR